MALPIPLEIPPRDPREELRVRLEKAPVEHAEALLAGLDVVQGLHDQGILNLLQGILGGGDRILEIAVDALKSPEAVRATRNLLILAQAFGSIDPDRLHAVMVDERPSPSLLGIAKQATSKESRRGLATAVGLLTLVGEALKAKGPSSGGR
jgi:uncharacterized protein YjgD (DUF1641 family)